MKLRLRQFAALLVVGLVASSCSGSADSEASGSSTDEPTPTTTAEAAPDLPGDGEIIYASSDAMCTSRVDGKNLEDKVACPEGASNYWFLSDQTLVVDVSKFDQEDEVDIRMESSFGVKIRWSKVNGFKATNQIGQDDYTAAFEEFFRLEGDYLVISTDLCAMHPKIERTESYYPGSYHFTYLELSLEYETTVETTEGNGFVLESTEPSLFHTMATNTLESSVDEQWNQSIYDHIHNLADGCTPEIETTKPTIPSEPNTGYVGRPDA